MVMERAARMAEQAKDTNTDESVVREGMRLAAEYLKNPQGSLSDRITGIDQTKRPQVVKGIADILLRNIVLPRDEMLLETGQKALAAIGELLGGTAGDICNELNQILAQYTQHKEQMKQQLEDAIRGQLKQKLMEQGAEISDEISINPAMHPQYAEELAKMETNLNTQYMEALDERKELIRQHLAPHFS